MWLVKFYCDVIARNCLQLINTLIDIFLVKFVPFSWNKDEGRPTMDKSKLNSAVDESSAD